MPDPQSRKLAAILAADITGYSVLMGSDEARTVRDLKDHQAVVLPMIGEFGGRIIDTAGDGILAEFASIVNAVECAVAIQKTMAERNGLVEETRRMQFRIGLNLGDVICDEARIYGDGINVAARLQGIAQPGGICISGKVYDEIRGKLALACEYLGEQQLKNIALSVPVYSVTLASSSALSGRLKVGALPLLLPDKPSIAVLPFVNLSADPEQEYFADGMVDEILMALSRFHSLFVIARNSSFIYKTKAVDIKQVGRQLGVRYVLQGSVRKSGQRVRITAQLIEAEGTAHVWAERYDGDLGDIFALQDQIVSSVVGAVVPSLQRAETHRAQRKPSESLDAYDCVLRGMAIHKSGHTTREEAKQAVAWFDRAIELDPNYARAHAWRACAASGLWPDQPTQAHFDESMKSVLTALSIDPSDSEVHRMKGALHTHQRQFERAVYHLQRARELNPNDAHVLIKGGLYRSYLGEHSKGLDDIDLAIRLHPQHPDWYWRERGTVLFGLGCYSEASDALRRYQEGHRSYVYQAASLAAAGEEARAGEEIEHLRQIQPGVDLGWVKQAFLYRCYRDPADLSRLIECLEAAGMS
jgi:adenylate cyclase